MADEHSNCGGCRFFRNQQVMGVCRLYPHQQNKHESDWCGQFEAIEVLSTYDITTDHITVVPQKRKYTRRSNDQAVA
jgi:hypothetical protein